MFKNWLWLWILLIIPPRDAQLHAQELFKDSLLFRVSPTRTNPQNADTNHILKILDSAKAYLHRQPDRAISYYHKAINESRTSGFKEGLVKALNGRATAAMYAGDYESALLFFQEALHYSPGLPLSIISDTYTGLAGLHIYKSQYTRAIWFFYKYLELAETHLEDNPPLARTYNNLSAVWRILQDDEKQYQYTKLAEKAALHEKDTTTLSSILFRKGLFIQDTNIRLGLKYHEQALSMGIQHKDNHTIIASLLNIARARRQLGELDQALQFTQHADSLLQVAEENPFNKLSFYNSLGESYYWLGMFDKAEQSALKAVELAKSLNTRTYLMRTYNLLTHIYEEQKNYSKAFISQKNYVNLKDSLTDEHTVQSANFLELKYQNLRMDRELAINQLAITNHKAALMRKNMVIGSIILGIFLIGTASWIVYRNMQTKSKMQQEAIRALEREREIEQMKAIMKGEDQESIRIGQELHDGIGSMLSVIKMNLSMIPQEHKELANSTQYQDILRLIDKTSTDLRETAHNLMLDSLLQGGLDEAIQHFCKKTADKHGIELHFQSYGPPPTALSGEFQRPLYRILRELIAHSVRQKNVTLVVVQFNWQEDMLSIIIEDDAQVTFESRSILDGLLSRINALNGRVDIEYGQEKGTTIDIEFDILQHLTET